jgi:hypothetical protein
MSKNTKPESYVAAFVYYAENEEETEIENNPSYPVLLELMNEMYMEAVDDGEVVMQVLEDAILVGNEEGHQAGVILIHTIHTGEKRGSKI